mgnify:FL=1
MYIYVYKPDPEPEARTRRPDPDPGGNALVTLTSRTIVRVSRRDSETTGTQNTAVGFFAGISVTTGD